jgi:hypothetical protein
MRFLCPVLNYKGEFFGYRCTLFFKLFFALFQRLMVSTGSTGKKEKSCKNFIVVLFLR